MEITGLALARRFFAVARPTLLMHAPEAMDHAAVGLVGEGSECFGFDDAISRDHDWGPGFCLWLPEACMERYAGQLETALAALPETFEGFPSRFTEKARREGASDRIGVLSIEHFYHRLAGVTQPPATLQDWRRLSEEALAACTNGEVFQDTPGIFTSFRTALNAFYPEPVRRKKMAARCMIMAQTGQYNLPRSLRRGETGAAMLAAARFAEAALSMAFLIEKRPMPFYKWACRAAQQIGPLGAGAAELTKLLSCTNWNDPEQGFPALDAIERYCTETADRLRSQGLCQNGGNWLWALGPELQRTIEDPELRRLDVMRD